MSDDTRAKIRDSFLRAGPIGAVCLVLMVAFMWVGYTVTNRMLSDAAIVRDRLLQHLDRSDALAERTAKAIEAMTTDNKQGRDAAVREILESCRRVRR